MLCGGGCRPEPLWLDLSQLLCLSAARREGGESRENPGPRARTSPEAPPPQRIPAPCGPRGGPFSPYPPRNPPTWKEGRPPPNAGLDSAGREGGGGRRGFGGGSGTSATSPAPASGRPVRPNQNLLRMGRAAAGNSRGRRAEVGARVRRVARGAGGPAGARADDVRRGPSSAPPSILAPQLLPPLVTCDLTEQPDRVVDVLFCRTARSPRSSAPPAPTRCSSSPPSTGCPRSRPSTPPLLQPLVTCDLEQPDRVDDVLTRRTRHG